jgi:hypothetical protein
VKFYNPRILGNRFKIYGSLTAPSAQYRQFINILHFSGNKLFGLATDFSESTKFHEITMDFDKGTVRTRNVFEVKNVDNVEEPAIWVSFFENAKNFLNSCLYIFLSCKNQIIFKSERY